MGICQVLFLYKMFTKLSSLNATVVVSSMCNLFFPVFDCFLDSFFCKD